MPDRSNFFVRSLFCGAVLGAALFAATATAQDPRDVSIVADKAAPDVYMLTGQGGNIGLYVGEGGAFMIDDQFAPLTPKILARIAELTDKPVRFLVNTHWHGDHTGGNENMGATGTVIVAHDNVRKRMSTDQFIEAFQRTTPASPPAALPVVTFDETVTFHLGDETVRVQHVAPAHTDGDSIVHFKKADVIHMGDTFFAGMYPFIDVSSGGSIDGVIDAAGVGLKLAGRDTRIIPGHGPMSDRAGLEAYRTMLVAVRANVRELIEGGNDRDAVIAAKPTAEFDDAWGGGFMQPDRWVGIVFDSMATGN